MENLQQLHAERALRKRETELLKEQEEGNLLGLTCAYDGQNSNKVLTIWGNRSGKRMKYLNDTGKNMVRLIPILNPPHRPTFLFGMGFCFLLSIPRSTE